MVMIGDVEIEVKLNTDNIQKTLDELQAQLNKLHLQIPTSIKGGGIGEATMGTGGSSPSGAPGAGGEVGGTKRVYTPTSAVPASSDMDIACCLKEDVKRVNSSINRASSKWVESFKKLQNSNEINFQAQYNQQASHYESVQSDNQKKNKEIWDINRNLHNLKWRLNTTIPHEIRGVKAQVKKGADVRLVGEVRSAFINARVDGMINKGPGNISQQGTVKAVESLGKKVGKEIDKAIKPVEWVADVFGAGEIVKVARESVATLAEQSIDTIGSKAMSPWFAGLQEKMKDLGGTFIATGQGVEKYNQTVLKQSEVTSKAFKGLREKIETLVINDSNSNVPEEKRSNIQGALSTLESEIETIGEKLAAGGEGLDLEKLEKATKEYEETFTKLIANLDGEISIEDIQKETSLLLIELNQLRRNIRIQKTGVYGAMENIMQHINESGAAMATAVSENRRASIRNDPKVLDNLKNLADEVEALGTGGKEIVTAAVGGYGPMPVGSTEEQKREKSEESFAGPIRKIFAEREYDSLIETILMEKANRSFEGNKSLDYVLNAFRTDQHNYSKDTFNIIARIIKTFLDNPNLKRFNVVGHSQGGAVTKEVMEAIHEMGLVEHLKTLLDREVEIVGMALATASVGQAKPDSNRPEGQAPDFASIVSPEDGVIKLWNLLARDAVLVPGGVAPENAGNIVTGHSANDLLDPRDVQDVFMNFLQHGMLPTAEIDQERLTGFQTILKAIGSEVALSREQGGPAYAVDAVKRMDETLRKVGFHKAVETGAKGIGYLSLLAARANVEQIQRPIEKYATEKQYESLIEELAQKIHSGDMSMNTLTLEPIQFLESNANADDAWRPIADYLKKNSPAEILPEITVLFDKQYQDQSKIVKDAIAKRVAVLDKTSQNKEKRIAEQEQKEYDARLAKKPEIADVEALENVPKNVSKRESEKRPPTAYEILSKSDINTLRQVASRLNVDLFKTIKDNKGQDRVTLKIAEDLVSELTDKIKEKFPKGQNKTRESSEFLQRMIGDLTVGEKEKNIGMEIIGLKLEELKKLTKSLGLKTTGTFVDKKGKESTQTLRQAELIKQILDNTEFLQTESATQEPKFNYLEVREKMVELGLSMRGKPVSEKLEKDSVQQLRMLSSLLNLPTKKDVVQADGSIRKVSLERPELIELIRTKSETEIEEARNIPIARAKKKEIISGMSLQNIARQLDIKTTKEVLSKSGVPSVEQKSAKELRNEILEKTHEEIQEAIEKLKDKTVIDERKEEEYIRYIEKTEESIKHNLQILTNKPSLFREKRRLKNVDGVLQELTDENENNYVEGEEDVVGALLAFLRAYKLENPQGQGDPTKSELQKELQAMQKFQKENVTSRTFQEKIRAFEENARRQLEKMKKVIDDELGEGAYDEAVAMSIDEFGNEEYKRFIGIMQEQYALPERIKKQEFERIDNLPISKKEKNKKKKELERSLNKYYTQEQIDKNIRETLDIERSVNAGEDTRHDKKLLKVERAFSQESALGSIYSRENMATSPLFTGPTGIVRDEETRLPDGRLKDKRKQLLTQAEFRDIGQAIIAGIEEGLTDREIQESIMQNLKDKWEREMEIKSPSRVMIRMGEMIIKGLEIGLQSFEKVKAYIIDSTKELIKNVENVIKNNPFNHFIPNAVESVKNTQPQILNKGKDQESPSKNTIKRTTINSSTVKPISGLDGIDQIIKNVENIIKNNPFDYLFSSDTNTKPAIPPQTQTSNKKEDKKNPLRDATDTLKNSVTNSVDTAKVAMDLKAATDVAWSQVSDIASKIQGIGEQIRKGFEIGLTSESVEETIMVDLLDKWEGIWGIQSPSKVMKKIGEMVVKGFEMGLMSFKGVEEYLIRNTKEIISILANLTDKSLFNVLETVDNIFEILKEKGRESLETGISIGNNIREGLEKGLNNLPVSETIMTDLLDKWKKAWGIQSPSTESKGIGKMIIKGLILGLQGFEKIKNYLINSTKEVISAMNELIKNSLFDKFNSEEFKADVTIKVHIVDTEVVTDRYVPDELKQKPLQRVEREKVKKEEAEKIKEERRVEREEAKKANRPAVKAKSRSEEIDLHMTGADKLMASFKKDHYLSKLKAIHEEELDLIETQLAKRNELIEENIKKAAGKRIKAEKKGESFIPESIVISATQSRSMVDVIQKYKDLTKDVQGEEKTSELMGSLLEVLPSGGNLQVRPPAFSEKSPQLHPYRGALLRERQQKEWSELVNKPLSSFSGDSPVTIRPEVGEDKKAYFEQENANFLSNIDSIPGLRTEDIENIKKQKEKEEKRKQAIGKELNDALDMTEAGRRIERKKLEIKKRILEIEKQKLEAENKALAEAKEVKKQYGERLKDLQKAERTALTDFLLYDDTQSSMPEKKERIAFLKRQQEEEWQKYESIPDKTFAGKSVDNFRLPRKYPQERLELFLENQRWDFELYLKEKEKEAKEGASKVGENIREGLEDGLNSQPVKETIMTDLEDKWKKEMEIHSPSEKTKRMGRMIIKGLELGLGSHKEVEEDLLKKTEAMIKKMKSLVEDSSSEEAGMNRSEMIRALPPSITSNIIIDIKVSDSFKATEASIVKSVDKMITTIEKRVKENPFVPLWSNLEKTQEKILKGTNGHKERKNLLPGSDIVSSENPSLQGIQKQVKERAEHRAKVVESSSLQTEIIRKQIKEGEQHRARVVVSSVSYAEIMRKKIEKEVSGRRKIEVDPYKTYNVDLNFYKQKALRPATYSLPEGGDNDEVQKLLSKAKRNIVPGPSYAEIMRRKVEREVKSREQIEVDPYKTYNVDLDYYRQKALSPAIYSLSEGEDGESKKLLSEARENIAEFGNNYVQMMKEELERLNDNLKGSAIVLYQGNKEREGKLENKDTNAPDPSDLPNSFDIPDDVSNNPTLPQGDTQEKGAGTGVVGTYTNFVKNGIIKKLLGLGVVTGLFLTLGEQIVKNKDFIIEFGQASLDASIQFESLQRALNYISGGAAEGTLKFKELKEMANSTGADLQGVVEAYNQLGAATKMTTLEGPTTDSLVKGVSQLGSLYGLSKDELQGAQLAISQMAGKGVVSSEELRGQLAERIPGAFQMASRAMKMTEKDFFKLMATGKLSSAEFLPKFAAQLEKESLAGLQGSTETTVALLNKMSNATTEIKLSLGEVLNPLNQIAIKIKTLGLQIIKTVLETGILQKAIVALILATGAISGPKIVTTLSAIVAKLWNLRKSITSVVPVLATLGVTLQTILIGVLLLYVAIEGVTAAYDQLTAVFGDNNIWTKWGKEGQENAKKIAKALEEVGEKQKLLNSAPEATDKNKVLRSGNFFSDYLFSNTSLETSIEHEIEKTNKDRKKEGKAAMTGEERDAYIEKRQWGGENRSNMNRQAQARVIRGERFDEIWEGVFNPALEEVNKYKAGKGLFKDVENSSAKIQKLKAQKTNLSPEDKVGAKNIDREIEKEESRKKASLVPLDFMETSMRSALESDKNILKAYEQAVIDQHLSGGFTEDEQKANEKKRKAAEDFLKTPGHQKKDMEDLKGQIALQEKAMSLFEKSQASSGAVNDLKRFTEALLELGVVFGSIEQRMNAINRASLKRISLAQNKGFEKDKFNEPMTTLRTAEEARKNTLRNLKERKESVTKIEEDLKKGAGYDESKATIKGEEEKRGRKLTGDEIRSMSEVLKAQDPGSAVVQSLEAEAQLRDEKEKTLDLEKQAVDDIYNVKMAQQGLFLAQLEDFRAEGQAKNQRALANATRRMNVGLKDGLKTDLGAEDKFNVGQGELQLKDIQNQIKLNEEAQAKIAEAYKIGKLSLADYTTQSRDLLTEDAQLKQQLAEQEIDNMRRVSQARINELQRIKDERDNLTQISIAKGDKDITRSSISQWKTNNTLSLTEPLERANKAKEDSKVLLDNTNLELQELEQRKAGMLLEEYIQRKRQLLLEQAQNEKALADAEMARIKAVEEFRMGMINKMKEIREANTQIATSNRNTGITRESISQWGTNENLSLEEPIKRAESSLIESQSSLRNTQSELKDLEKAYAEGALSVERYVNEKRRLLTEQAQKEQS